LRQEAQRRRWGHWEGGWVQARDVGARRQDPELQTQPGPMDSEARRHKDSREEVELGICHEKM